MSISQSTRYFNVKPLTTNPKLSIANQSDLSIADNTVKGASGYPNYQLNVAPRVEFSVDGHESTEIVASDLPQKMETPFYQIYSDIINTDYYTQKNRMNIIGVIPRNYETGDFTYAFSTNYTVPCLFPQKISSITTEIRSNGRLAPISSKSSVIYKVTRNIELLQDDSTS